MEHNRIHILENIRIEDTGLAAGYPVFEAALGKDGFGYNLGAGIVIVNRDFDGVAAARPMNRSVSVAGFGNGADIYNLDGVGIGLSLDSFYDISRGSCIGYNGLGRIIVGRGRNHTADMKNIIGTVNAFLDGIIILEIAPYDSDGRIIDIFSELFSVLLAVAQKNYDVELILVLKKLKKTLIPHIA